MPKFRKKPVVIDAEQFMPANRPVAPIFALDPKGSISDCGEYLEISTLEGTMRADPGDWIIKGVKGEIYPCKPDIFEATYDPAEPPAIMAEFTPEQQKAFEEEWSKSPPGGVTWLPDPGPAVGGAFKDAMLHGEGWTLDGVPIPIEEIREKGIPIGASRSINENDPRHPNQRYTRFRDELEGLINSHSMENGSDTPDFLLASFIVDMLMAFDQMMLRRDGWYGGSHRTLKAQLEAEGAHTEAGQAEISRLHACLVGCGAEIQSLKNQLGAIQRAGNGKSSENPD